MAFKSATQPLCRYCGKKIAKWTETVYVRDRSVRSKADCEKRTNQKVVSVRYEDPGRFKRSAPKDYYTEAEICEAEAQGRWVDMFTTWDGESYQDEFFCNGTHAQYFGYAAARAGQAMPEYNKAKKVANG